MEYQLGPVNLGIESKPGGSEVHIEGKPSDILIHFSLLADCLHNRCDIPLAVLAGAVHASGEMMAKICEQQIVIDGHQLRRQADSDKE